MQSNILWLIYALLKHLFLLLTVDNVFTYETENEGTKQLMLDEKDEIWLKLRHEFIGDIKELLDVELQKIQDLDKQYQVAAKSGRLLFQPVFEITVVITFGYEKPNIVCQKSRINSKSNSCFIYNNTLK